MPDMNKIIEVLEKAKMVIERWIPMFEQYNTPAGIDVAISLLKEQEGTINELQNAYGYLQKQFFEVQDELLEEQKAVPVIQREVMHMLVWCCGSCGVAITDGDKFCRNCGRKVKWE